MRKIPGPSEVFLSRIKVLIKNLLIENVNYNNSHYENNRGEIDADSFCRLLEDTKERANYILNEIESIKHLIELLK